MARRRAFKSVPELIDAIASYIQTRNEDPKPFVWTKTADQIIEKLMLDNEYENELTGRHTSCH